MTRRIAQRPLHLFLVATLLAVLAGASTTSAGAASPPALRILTASEKVTLHRERGRVPLEELGVWLASVGGAFELRVWRDDYRDPVRIQQVDAATGEMLRELPADTLAGWGGLRRFLGVTVRDHSGNVVRRRSFNVCLDTWSQERVGDEGPAVPTYPQFCSTNPLTKGTVWGVDEGWAVDPFTNYYSYARLRIPTGHYAFEVRIARRFAELLGIPEGDTSATLDVRVVPSSGHHHLGRRGAPERAGPATQRVPDVTDPDPENLPDLVALPAWGMNIVRHGRSQYLAFNATEWNAGAQPLVVEGFRRSGEPVMDAYQYFYEGGEAIGRAPAGTLEFDTRRGHLHWHFQQFVTYSLLDSTKTEVVRSKKQSFCLAPTDAIDLTIPGANWSPYSIGLTTSSCGRPGSIWIRETLDAGWGDTYVQTKAGQSFNITGLPNGRYFVEVHVNPLGALYDRSADNDVALRKIWLGGKPGRRRVSVPPWHGIDTENYCPGGCF